MHHDLKFRSHGTTQPPAKRAALLSLFCCAACLFIPADPAPVHAQANQTPLYKQSGAPVEARIDDLIHRMTLEEKARQLDMYSSAPKTLKKNTANPHAPPQPVFLPA